EKVVSDTYFREVRTTRDRDALLRARTMSWAFTFYLCQQRPDGLIRYYQELQNMPRDLEFDREVLLGCFARALDLADPTKPGGIDRTGLLAIGRDWYDTMNLWNLPVPTDAAKMLQTYARIQAGATVKKDKDAPEGVTGGPGGRPGGGGAPGGGRPGGGGAPGGGRPGGGGQPQRPN